MDKFVVTLPGYKRKLNSAFSSSRNENKANCGFTFSPQGKSSSTNLSVKDISNDLKKEGKVQMCLDLGQKSLGTTKTCSLCGMVYLLGDDEDESRHKRFCNSKSIQRSNITYPCLSSKKLVLIGNKTNDSIIKITQQEKFHKESLNRLFEVVKDEIGSEIEFVTQKTDDTILLYLRGSENLIIGAVVLEMVDTSEVVSIEEDVDISTVFTLNSIHTARERESKKSHGGSSANNNSGDFGKGDLISNTNKKARSSTVSNSHLVVGTTIDTASKKLLGVKIIWVSPASRGHGVAGCLLDAARSNSRYGCVYGKKDIAFSQPTAAGKKFAFKYSFENDNKQNSINSINSQAYNSELELSALCKRTVFIYK